MRLQFAPVRISSHYSTHQSIGQVRCWNPQVSKDNYRIFFFFLLVLSTNTLSHSVGQSIYLLFCTQQAYFNLFSNSISLPWDGLLYVVHGRNSIIISIITIMKECKWEKSVGHTQGRIIMSPQSFFQDVFIISIAISF